MDIDEESLVWESRLASQEFVREFLRAFLYAAGWGREERREQVQKWIGQCQCLSLDKVPAMVQRIMREFADIEIPFSNPEQIYSVWDTRIYRRISETRTATIGNSTDHRLTSSSRDENDGVLPNTVPDVSLVREHHPNEKLALGDGWSSDHRTGLFHVDGKEWIITAGWRQGRLAFWPRSCECQRRFRGRRLRLLHRLKSAVERVVSEDVFEIGRIRDASSNRALSNTQLVYADR